MDPLLTEYASLYKLAFADVSSLSIVKVANVKGEVAEQAGGWLSRNIPSVFGRKGQQVAEAVTEAAPPPTYWDELATNRTLKETGTAAEQAYKKQMAEHAAEVAANKARMTPLRHDALKEVGIDAKTYDEVMAERAAAEAAKATGAAAPAAQAAAPAAGQAAGQAAEGGGNALRNTLIGGTAVAGAGLAGHQYGAMKEEERGNRNRNLAFGAGAAAGIAAPGLMKNLGPTMQGVQGLMSGAQPPSAPRPHASAYSGGLSPQQQMMMRQRGY